LRSAKGVKKFVTDEKLRAWGLFVEGQGHAMDAVRHGCHGLLFR
jgi:hypothetical protein